jgi:arginyl-tRNA synthetase
VTTFSATRLSKLAPEGCSMRVRQSPGTEWDGIVYIPAREANKLPIRRVLLASDLIASAQQTKQAVLFKVTDQFVDEGLHELRGLARPRPSQSLAGAPCLIDMCDPNANKPLHIGHLRNLAIGSALGSLLQSAGASVDYQAVVCDIGRSIAEAMAGCSQDGVDAQTLTALTRPDTAVGASYARYVTKGGQRKGGQRGRATSADPVERESERIDDHATEMLDLWRQNDPDVTALWRAIVDGVLAGQSRTVSTLGIEINRLLMESCSLPSAARLLEQGLAADVLVRRGDGSVFFRSGREDFAEFPLIRTDGFPTEHLRATAIWHELQSQPSAEDYHLCLHVTGSEWVPGTELRQALLDALGVPFPLKSYQPVYHGMVRYHGGDMKSSTGDVCLIEDALEQVADRLQAQYGEAWAMPAAARIALLGYFLAQPLRRTIDYDVNMIASRRTNPALACVAEMVEASQNIGRYDSDPRCPLNRFLVLQAADLPSRVEAAYATAEPSLILKAAAHLATSVRAGSGPRRDPQLSWHVLACVLSWLGLVPSPTEDRATAA